MLKFCFIPFRAFLYFIFSFMYFNNRTPLLLLLLLLLLLFYYYCYYYYYYYYYYFKPKACQANLYHFTFIQWEK